MYMICIVQRWPRTNKSYFAFHFNLEMLCYNVDFLSCAIESVQCLCALHLYFSFVISEETCRQMMPANQLLERNNEILITDYIVVTVHTCIFYGTVN